MKPFWNDGKLKTLTHFELIAKPVIVSYLAADPAVSLLLD
jgi:hypothetical protein